MGFRVVFSCLAFLFSGVAAAGGHGSSSQLVLNFSTSFGGSSSSAYVLQFGSTATIPTELRPFYSGNTLPVSGISYSSVSGLSPMLLGLAAVRSSQGLNADGENGGISWGWIAAGVAVAAGAVVVLSDDGGSSNESDEPEEGGNTCIGGTTLVPPSDDTSIDPDACQGILN